MCVCVYTCVREIDDIYLNMQMYKKILLNIIAVFSKYMVYLNTLFQLIAKVGKNLCLLLSCTLIMAIRDIIVK